MAAADRLAAFRRCGCGVFGGVGGGAGLVSSHHDLMAATFSADGVVPSLSQMFHGPVLGAAVLVAAAAAGGLSLRLLRRVIAAPGGC